jgi:hypothetical protein
MDKLFSQELLVAQTYSAMQEIRKELGSEAPQSQISPELAAIIEEEIRPEYALREQRSHIKNQLTITTTAAAILAAVLPDPIGAIVSVPLFLFAVPVVLRLYKSYLPKDPVGRKLYTWRILYLGSFFGVIGAVLYPVSLSLRGVAPYRFGAHLAVAATAAFALLFSGLLFFVRARYLARTAGSRTAKDAHPAVPPG